MEEKQKEKNRGKKGRKNTDNICRFSGDYSFLQGQVKPTELHLKSRGPEKMIVWIRKKRKKRGGREKRRRHFPRLSGE